MASSSRPAKPPTQGDVDAAVAEANAAQAEAIEAEADTRVTRDRRAELARQAEVEDAVAEWNAAEAKRIADERAEDDRARDKAAAEAATRQAQAEAAERKRAQAAQDAAEAELRPKVRERSAAWRSTEAVSTVRVADQAKREVAGMAVPYGQVALSTDVGPEAFAPGAFRDSVAHWMGRQDGARMAFRPGHKQPAVGTVTELRDTADGVMFTARIREGEVGDAYLRDVADGLNGVSIEFGPGDTPPRRGRDGLTVHSAARLHAIAGSDNPAYDSARLSLRDMEGDTSVKCKHCEAELQYGVGHDCPKAPGKDQAPADDTGGTAAAPAEGGERGGLSSSTDGSAVVIHLDQRTRQALEAAGVRGLTPSIRQTSAPHVYSRDAKDTFLTDNFRAAHGDWEAQQRQQKHYGNLQEVAVAQEREAVWRMTTGVSSERAGDVLSSEIPGAYPNDYQPGLLTPRILKGRPMGGFYQRVPISDARPRIFPKVTTSTAVAQQSAEGAALSSTDFATTAVTVTPLMYGAYTDVSRQVIDGADPVAQAMILQDLQEAYSQTSEGVVKTAVEAGSTASGVAITAATPYAGAIANVVNYYSTRFTTAKRAFIPPAQFSTLLSQLDTTGRPLVPQIGPVNSDGSVSTDGDQIVAPLLSAQGTLAWQATVNVWVFGVSTDFVIYESSVAQFTYEQVVGPQAVRIGIWAYLVVGTRLGSLKVTAA